MMRNLLLISIMLLVGVSSVAQETKRIFVKKSNGYIQLVGEDILAYSAYLKQKGVKKRTITTPNNKYTILKKNTPQGQYQEILNEDGVLMGKVYLSGKFKNDLVLSSGARYDWEDTGKHSWQYKIDGNIVLTGYYKKVGKDHTLFHSLNANSVNEILELSSYERGMEEMKSNPNLPLYLILGAGLVIMQQSRL